MNYIEPIKTKVSEVYKKALEKGSPYFGFVKNSLFQRWAIAVILCSILALIMAPELNFSKPQFQIGMIAPKNIKADFAFLVEDKQATEEKKIIDAENIKPVYNYNGQIADNIGRKIVKSFALAAEKQNIVPDVNILKSGDAHILQKEKKRLESNMGVYLSPEEFYVLNEHKFSEELQQKFSQLIISFYENRFITSDIFGKSEKQKGIVIRNLKTQISEDIRDTSSLLSIYEIDEPLLKTVNMIFRNDENALKETAFSLAKKLIEPNLTFNKEITEKKKMALMGDTTSTFFQVQKNEMIVREGEKIGYLELAKLNAYFKDAQENRFSRLTVMLGFFLTAMFLSIVLISGAHGTGVKRPTAPISICSFSALSPCCKFFLSKSEFLFPLPSTDPFLSYRRKPASSPFPLPWAR